MPVGAIFFRINHVGTDVIEQLLVGLTVQGNLGDIQMSSWI